MLIQVTSFGGKDQGASLGKQHTEAFLGQRIVKLHYNIRAKTYWNYDLFEWRVRVTVWGNTGSWDILVDGHLVEVVFWQSKIIDKIFFVNDWFYWLWDFSYLLFCIDTVFSIEKTIAEMLYPSMGKILPVSFVDFLKDLLLFL